MPLTLKRAVSKGSQRFEFVLHIHTLAPFPDGHGPLIVEWERGTKRQGALPPASPQHLPGGRGVQYRFDTGEPLRIPCTLHTVWCVWCLCRECVVCAWCVWCAAM